MTEFESLQKTVTQINSSIKNCNIEASSHKSMYKLSNLPIQKTFYGNYIQCITCLHNEVVLLNLLSKKELVDKSENNDMIDSEVKE